MKLEYCLQCAAPLKKLNDTDYICQNGHQFWNNPMATVGVVMVRDGQVLVSKRAFVPNKGQYDLPGGFLQYGEAVFDGARREILEETGIDLTGATMRVVAAYTGFYNENESVCDIIVYVQNWQGEPVAADDSEALEWQPFDFITSEQFAPDYTGLPEIIRNIV